MQTLVTRVELDLIGKHAPWPLGKRTISDVPQATKSMQFGKKLHTLSSIGVNVRQLNKYTVYENSTLIAPQARKSVLLISGWERAMWVSGSTASVPETDLRSCDGWECSVWSSPCTQRTPAETGRGKVTVRLRSRPDSIQHAQQRVFGITVFRCSWYALQQCGYNYTVKFLWDFPPHMQCRHTVYMYSCPLPTPSYVDLVSSLDPPRPNPQGRI